jgi:Uma2 family endonuclease
MVTTPIAPRLDEIQFSEPEIEETGKPQIATLEEFLLAPVEQMEWVDDQLVEKTGMTVKHGKIQLDLGFHWKNHIRSSGLGGEVFTEAPCQTINRGRRPDVSYATPALLAQIGNAASAPQSFSLIAEIVSPTDEAEMIFSKAQEYLQSGCEEVWLVMPENRYVFVITAERRLWFAAGETVSTQVVLPGFSMAIDELLAWG